jgi:hypothetical protein
VQTVRLHAIVVIVVELDVKIRSIYFRGMVVFRTLGMIGRVLSMYQLNALLLR